MPRLHRDRRSHAGLRGLSGGAKHLSARRPAGEPLAHRGHRRLQCVHHRLVTRYRRPQVLDRRQRRGHRIDELGEVECRFVAQGSTRLAKRRSPERTACAADGRDERLAGEDQQLAGRPIRLGAQGECHRIEPTIEVDAVVAVADRGVELDQVVPLGAHRRGDLIHPRGDGLRVHCYSDRHDSISLPSAGQPCGRAHPRAWSARRRARGP